VSAQEIEESNLEPNIRYEKFQVAFDVVGSTASMSQRKVRPTVDVFILDPSDKVLKVFMKQGLGEFTFFVETPGEYSIIISNIKVSLSDKV